MEFVGFSFHFVNKADADKASAAAARMDEGRAGRGIDPSSLQLLADGFYIGWSKQNVKCSGARSFLARVPATIDRSAKSVKMCGHHSAPPTDQDYEKMTVLTKEERGGDLAFYQIRLAVGQPVVGNGALAAVASSSSIRVQSSRLPVVAAAAPKATEIIQATSACWSLGLLRRDPILKARSNLYTVGTKLGEGSNGVVFKVTFSGNVEGKLCAKLLRSDSDEQTMTRIEVYALERCNESPSGFVRLLDVFVKSHNIDEWRVYLVMEMWEMDVNTFMKKGSPTPLQLRSALRGPMEGLRFLHDHLLLVHCDVASKNILIRVTLAAAVPDIVAVLGDLGSVMEVCVHPRPLVISQLEAPQQSGQTHIHWVGPLLVRAWAVGWVGS